MTGAELISAERMRQVSKCGWTAENDAKQEDGQLLECAIQVADDVFANQNALIDGREKTEHWPHQRANHIVEKYKSDHISRLVIAGALIAAEIDRLQRIQG